MESLEESRSGTDPNSPVGAEARAFLPPLPFRGRPRFPIACAVGCPVIAPLWRSLSKDPSVAERVAAGLRVHTQAMGTLAHRNPREQLPIVRIDGVDLAIVAAGEPQHVAIGRNTAHVRTRLARELPFLNHLAR